MILLTGKSLNERHRELNSIVNDAATQGVSFEDVKLQTEKSDVDRIYKIKLANKYRNIEYIIETLKCGNNLYISKALKCAWLCDVEFSNIINPEYLQENVFPEMSLKAKRKFLTMISMRVYNERTASFYTHCMETKLSNIAIKFLVNTTEAFKIDAIKGINWQSYCHEVQIAIIGNSFTLADILLESLLQNTLVNYLRSLRHLYSVSNTKYLDLIEKHVYINELIWDENQRLGLRISKHIIKNHKDRISRHTVLYINILNKSMLIKYSSPEDVKCYSSQLLPSDCWDFWNENFYSKYNFLLDIIPLEERLQFIKHIFTTRYPGRKFELDFNFFLTRLYELMTKEEKSCWALKHVNMNIEHFGYGRNYIWYQFVPFDKALLAIKQYILNAADAHLRYDILRVLIFSAQSNRELEALFSYYYQSHINEITHYKETFVREVFNIHKYYDFDEGCWNSFNKILHSMDVYDNNNGHASIKEYRMAAMIYAIIHDREVHKALKQFIDDGIDMYRLTQETSNLSKEKTELVYQYLIKAYLGRISEYDIEKYYDGVKHAVRKYINYIFDIIFHYNKTRIAIPELVMKYVYLDFEEYSPLYYGIRQETDTLFTRDHEAYCYLNQASLLKDLKLDASLIVSKIPSIEIAFKENPSLRLNKLFRKMRVYFSTDVAIKYTELFKELLASENLSEKMYDLSVYGLFQIADDDYKIEFVMKYFPTNPKIIHDEIERKLLYIRKAICKYVCLSRPVVPLRLVQKYIVGDYLKFCMPMMQSYAANLQPAPLTEFVNFLLSCPVSVQIQGIRLAFKCFSITDVKCVVTNMWNSTSNVSLRFVMYNKSYKTVINENNKDKQLDLFEVFNTLSLDLSKIDDYRCFNILLKTDLPIHILGEHILSAWQTLNQLPDEWIFCKHKCGIIENMTKNIHLMDQDIIDTIVSEHIKFMLQEENIERHYDCYVRNISRAKWNLTAKHLVYLRNRGDIKRKINVVQLITRECIRLWDTVNDNVYVIRVFLKEFIDTIRNNISCTERNSCLSGIRLLEQILKGLENAIPLAEIYETVWSLRLNIILGNIVAHAPQICEEYPYYDQIQIFSDCVDKFAIQFTNLLNEFIIQGKYYNSVRSAILQILTNISSYVLRKLPFFTFMSQDDIFVVISSKLVEIHKFETYYFALALLPNYHDYDGVLYRRVIRKIEWFDNDEIKYVIYTREPPIRPDLLSKRAILRTFGPIEKHSNVQLVDPRKRSRHSC